MNNSSHNVVLIFITGLVKHDYSDEQCVGLV